ncbi:lysine-rich arabinogalactan protein 19-like [Nilaparvata lugens]|uniref:lysine-rich arabinogalactan protein 19-like n=1 Tax=Nilaparvata lugens TaxID=108931 RepID=UPI00193D917F|nr:lysine-rich arabinogalactan protein 19-like [Nilaparvata lugens]
MNRETSTNTPAPISTSAAEINSAQEEWTEDGAMAMLEQELHSISLAALPDLFDDDDSILLYISEDAFNHHQLGQAIPTSSSSPANQLGQAIPSSSSSSSPATSFASPSPLSVSPQPTFPPACPAYQPARAVLPPPAGPSSPATSFAPPSPLPVSPQPAFPPARSAYQPA